MKIKKLLLALLLSAVIMPSNCSVFAWLRGAWQKAGSYYRHHSSYILNCINYIPAFLQVNIKREMHYEKPAPRPILNDMHFKKNWTYAQLIAFMNAQMEVLKEKGIIRDFERDVNTRDRLIYENIHGNLEGCIDKDYKGQFDDAFSQIIEQEAEEQIIKGRCLGFHGRQSGQLVMDLIFKKLLEMHYVRPIKDSWQTIHHKFLKEYQSYEEGLNKIKTGNSLREAAKDFNLDMLFLSQLNSRAESESAMYFMAINGQCDHAFANNSPYSCESLFKKFNLGKSYERHQVEIDELNDKCKKMKYGMLLMFSLSKELSDELCFASQHYCGLKKEIVFEHITTGKQIKTMDMYEARTLLQNKEYKRLIESLDQEYVLKLEPVYVMALTDNDKANGKLGAVNPFNPDIDIYRFHVYPEDQKIVKEVEEGVDKLFKKIRVEIAFDAIKEKIKSGDILKKPVIYQGLEKEI